MYPGIGPIKFDVLQFEEPFDNWQQHVAWRDFAHKGIVPPLEDL